MTDVDYGLKEVTGLTKLDSIPFLATQRWKRPDYMRGSCNPATGDMAIGVVARHLNHIPSSETSGFDAWVRGFYFDREHLIAVRPWFWPLQEEDQFSRKDSRVVIEPMPTAPMPMGLPAG